MSRHTPNAKQIFLYPLEKLSILLACEWSGNLLGEASTALDWGIKTDNEVNMDASAGISMGSGRGLGKAKHVDTQYHWGQGRVG